MENDVKGGSKTITKIERRTCIRERIETVGIWSMNISNLAKEFGVSRQAIYRDIRKLREILDKEDITQTKIELSCACKRAISEARRVITTPDSPIELKLRAISVLMSAISDYIRFLQVFELKEETDQESKTEMFKREQERYAPQFEKLSKMPQEVQDLVRDILVGRVLEDREKTEGKSEEE